MTIEQAPTSAFPAGVSAQVNARESIERRASAGRILWSGPLVVMAARSGLIVLAQVLVTLIFYLKGSPNPLKDGTVWWTITGTLVDAGCLGLMIWYTRREGIRLVDLIGIQKGKLGRDILIGLGMLVVIFPIVMIGGGMLSGLIVYGSLQPAQTAALMTRPLPLWAALYSRTIWWLIWSVTEEMTYNGYALPRLQVLLHGRTWLAVVMVGFFWAFQHAFLPLLLDPKLFLYLGIQMLPLVVVSQIIYLRFRRLPPMIILHWGMDFFSVMYMITVV
jgi:uncharacterized protein